jgi:hypothetical protein
MHTGFHWKRLFVVYYETIKRGVPRVTGRPKDREEVNKREVEEGDG